jgi:recombination protein RecR
MTNLDKLIAYFEGFPGIGGRQAKRFAFHVLRMNDQDVDELSSLIANLKATVAECERCHRFFSYSNQVKQAQCNICSDPNRDHTKLLVVERDNDITPIERSGVYDGLYFVLGDQLAEVILGFAVNPDGENTARYVQQLLKEFVEGSDLKISELGRGLSTGSELEYADPETLKNALSNRH